MNFYYICTIYICTTSVHFTPALRLYGKNILECYRNLCPVYFIFCPSFCALLFSRAGVWVPPGEVGYDTAMPSSGNPFTTGFHFPTQRSVLLQKRGDDAIFFVAQRKKKSLWFLTGGARAFLTRREGADCGNWIHCWNFERWDVVRWKEEKAFHQAWEEKESV